MSVVTLELETMSPFSCKFMKEQTANLVSNKKKHNTWIDLFCDKRLLMLD